MRIYEWRSAGSSTHSLQPRKNRLFGPHFRHSNDNYISHTKKMPNAKVKILLTFSLCDEKRAHVIHISIDTSVQWRNAGSLSYAFRDNDLHMEVNTAEWPCSFTLHCVTLGLPSKLTILALTILHSTVYCCVPFLRNYTTYELRYICTRKLR